MASSEAWIDEKLTRHTTRTDASMFPPRRLVRSIAPATATTSTATSATTSRWRVNRADTQLRRTNDAENSE
jgi:hypothetical protein